MTIQTPAFQLKIADALVDEVAENTDAVLQAARKLQAREGFMDGLRGAMAAGALLGSLKNNLVLGMRLADASAKSNPSIKLDDGTTPATVKARALFQEGLIAMGQKNMKDAVKRFEESVQYVADQSTYFNIALCFLEMKGLFTDKTKDAVTALEKCIDLVPDSELAIAAGKELARLGRL